MSPFFWTTALGMPLRESEPRLLLHVAYLAVDRHEDLGPQPAIDRLQLRPPGMAGDVDFALPVGDHLDAAIGEQVLDAADGELVAGNLAAREQHDVALASGSSGCCPRRCGRARRAARPARRWRGSCTLPRGRSIAASKSTGCGKSCR